MSGSALKIVQDLLANATKRDVVEDLVAHDATYISLAFSNPALQSVLPWTGTHEKAGPSAIYDTFVGVNAYWDVVEFTPQHSFSDDGNVAVFGTFTLKSKTLGKQVTSPFAVFAKVTGGKVIEMRYMEDTFATASTFRSAGEWTFTSDPQGGEVAV